MKDAAVAEWLYEHKPLNETEFVNGPSYRNYRLNLPIVTTLHRLASGLLSDIVDPNCFYLFDKHALHGRSEQYSTAPAQTAPPVAPAPASPPTPPSGGKIQLRL